ncbi:ARM repeat-containing protein [Xylona heveae TC161]|uniref:ARM repeat-containing protein n=1 Tax=Xylona heveae (strain CBS 132557 / TC161) TaxID=1328760 RepID=A0A165F7L0_XYLHT|nr:ARM repeat-containing protein [Xylona heveae TC161]KZF20668.1 ARM repeat-containing protein [Xylona heveae TC161]
MSFTTGLKVDDMRFRGPQSPHDSSPFPQFNSLYGGGSNPLQRPSRASADARSSLQRRFTTDSAKMPSTSPFSHQRVQTAESLDLTSATFHKVQLLEKKRMEYELLKEQRRRFEAEMHLIDLQQKREEEDIRKMAKDLERVHPSAGHQSEPTTPPEYPESIFSTVFPRHNRLSSSSITSPPGLTSRSVRSSSQLTSPPPELVSSFPSTILPNKLPSKSVPASRRNSDENELQHESEVFKTDHRSAAAMNRNSMPASGLNFRMRSTRPELGSVFSLGQINTTGFLFGDDDERAAPKKDHNQATSPDVKSYLQMNATDDKFPILVRRNDFPGLLSASSAALDLALSQSPGPETKSNGWPPFTHRPAQHSLPQNSFNLHQNVAQAKHAKQNDHSPRVAFRQSDHSTNESPSRTSRVHKNPLEVKFGPLGDQGRPSRASNNTSSHAPPKLQSSYSTNDIPTMKSSNGLAGLGSPKTHAQQHLQNHNASMGRIPPVALQSRHSRELSGGELHREEQANTFPSIQSGLQGNAPPFGPLLSSSSSNGSTQDTSNPTGVPPYGSPSSYGGYGMQMLHSGLNNFHIGPAAQTNGHMQIMAPPSPFPSYHPYNQYGARIPDSQARVIQQRRMQNDNARFTNVQLEHLRGEIYSLCKDQHGCRYLQKKLEERNPEYVHMIFRETSQHIVELMTDPFGNYLCQKLLEFANDEERTVLINNAAPQMVRIALNQHGTRALQKMIEFVSTSEQTQTIIYALRDRVVELIQDLNGNHVIQKCLNRLSAEDAQFIFDAVGTNCVVVGTHRHGCCVLQRCIDHASGHQKAQLVRQISANSFSLVQDPFGNYVIQYILDLGESAFSEPLWGGFLGKVPTLSKQKFSSNVIEKCLRTADINTRRAMIEEMLNPNELEKMLRDSFANYVVQTAVCLLAWMFRIIVLADRKVA